MLGAEVGLKAQLLGQQAATVAQWTHSSLQGSCSQMRTAAGALGELSVVRLAVAETL